MERLKISLVFGLLAVLLGLRLGPAAFLKEKPSEAAPELTEPVAEDSLQEMVAWFSDPGSYDAFEMASQRAQREICARPSQEQKRLETIIAVKSIMEPR